MMATEHVEFTAPEQVAAEVRRLMAERAAIPAYAEGRRMRWQKLAEIDALLDEYNFLVAHEEPTL